LNITILVFIERERLAEDILTNKQLVILNFLSNLHLCLFTNLSLFKIVDYDRTRNTNREALTKLKKEPLNSQKKVWVNLGDFFIKLEKDNVTSYIEKGLLKIFLILDFLYHA
jgi:hypothetical protein